MYLEDISRRLTESGTEPIALPCLAHAQPRGNPSAEARHHDVRNTILVYSVQCL